MGIRRLLTALFERVRETAGDVLHCAVSSCKFIIIGPNGAYELV